MAAAMARVFFFAPSLQNIGESRLVITVYNIRRSERIVAVHSHIERRVLHIREAAARIVYLVRADSISIRAPSSIMSLNIFSASEKFERITV